MGKRKASKEIVVIDLESSSSLTSGNSLSFSVSFSNIEVESVASLL